MPEKISFEDQLEVVEHVVEYGAETAFNWHGDRQQIWKSSLVRHLDRPSITEEILSEFKLQNRSADFGLRNRTDLKWVWKDDVLSKKIQKILAPLGKYFLELGRVQILLQKPFEYLRAHHDLMAGEVYDQQKYLPFESPLFQATKLHEHNGYLTVKIPLTEHRLQNGLPYIKVGQDFFNYNVQNHPFVINEVQIDHGSQTPGFWRGVISIDAKLDLVQLQKIKIEPILAPIKYQDVFRRVMLVKKKNQNSFFPGDLSMTRLDLRALFNDYKNLRLKSSSFLGGTFCFSPDQMTFYKTEFWRSEREQIEFYHNHENFIRKMVMTYNDICQNQLVSVNRQGANTSYLSLSEYEKECILDKKLQLYPFFDSECFH